MFGAYHRNRLLLALGAVWCVIVFRAGGEWFNIPQFVSYDVSLLAQPARFATLLIVLLAICACSISATLISGSVRADAGLFCTALGMIALSLRGGAMRYIIFADPESSVFYRLVFELVLLFAFLLIGWLMIRPLAAIGLTKRNDPNFTHDPIPLDQKFLATAIQACATATIVLILCRTDAKVQAIASVGVASMLGSILAVTVAPTRPSVWYWIGPMFVGMLGYIWASFSPQLLSIGQVSGYFAALARPVPLDYASAGTAGAMLGYWFARSWMTTGESESDDQSPTVPSGAASGGALE